MQNWPFKSIFVPCVPSENIAGTAMEYAASLAAKDNSHLTVRVLGSKIAQPFSFASGITGGYVGAANEATQTQVDQTVASIHNRYGNADFVLDVQGVVRSHTDLAAVTGYHGRLHDISVTDRLNDFLSEGRAMMEELLFSSGRPVIVVPPSVTVFSARKVMVAWDGSARAARAVHDALPILARADQVQLVCVVQDKDHASRVPGSEIAPMLARHGVTVEVVDIHGKDAEAGQVLLEQARKSGADLIVMGAYSHARFRQLVLGGVTQDMLDQSVLPVFYSY
ncbi:MAG: universal stress protein [Beijerinckiaceae bacterium]